MHLRATILAIMLSAVGEAYAATITHYWATKVGGREVGLVEYHDSFTGRLDTEVYYGFGHWQFDLPLLAVIAIPSIFPIAVAIYFYARHRRRHNAA